MQILQAIYEVLDLIARVIGWGFLLVLVFVLGILLVVEVYEIGLKVHKEGRKGRSLAKVLVRRKRREEYSENDPSIVLNQECSHCLIPLDAHDHCPMCERTIHAGF